MRALITALCVGSLGFGLVLAACGGATAGNIAGSDSGAGGPGIDGGGGGDGGVMTTGPGEAGETSTGTPTPAPCAAPADPTKSALCITVTPEAIDYTSDPNFDGKGYLVAQVFGTSLPDYPDGGELPALAAQSFGAPDAGTIDLSQPLPAIRFDGLTATVYPRVIFVDGPTLSGSIGAGTWLAGYDLDQGLGGQPPLVAQPLVAGTGTSVTMKLSALRELVVTMRRTVPPAGNGEGAATFIATTDQIPGNSSPLFGIGQNPCARVDGTNMATISGFVIGAGPYYVAGILDDFGLADGGVALPPGALVSLQSENGGLQIPTADQLTYAPTAYRVSQTISLGLVLPGAPATDGVSCP
ncbi:MAG TPA: hypothetical protein VIJ22_01705 [Polyangiaceae bacterium]